MRTRGIIDVYPIGDGIGTRIRHYRLERACADITPPKFRRTPDRWRRRWQAEHSGEYDHLGAVRAWTRTGAYIRMHKRITAHKNKMS